MMFMTCAGGIRERMQDLENIATLHDFLYAIKLMGHLEHSECVDLNAEGLCM